MAPRVHAPGLAERPCLTHAPSQRLLRKHPNLALVHGPVHAGWLNQIEIYRTICGWLPRPDWLCKSSPLMSERSKSRSRRDVDDALVSKAPERR